MQLQLADTIKQHLNSKETGLLSVKIKGGPHLLKVYFVQGQVTNLQYGIAKNSECFSIIHTSNVESIHFMRDVRSPANGSDLSLTQMLCSQIGEAGLAGNGSADTVVRSDKVAQAVNDFIEVVGPIGQISVSEFYDKQKYIQGNPMSGKNFYQFIMQLAAELPEQHRRGFFKTHIPDI